MNDKNKESLLLFSVGFLFAVLIIAIWFLIITPTIKPHPVVQYDIVINRNGDVVINYWVWDEANENFLSGLNSDIYTLESLQTLQRNYNWWGD